MKDEEVVARFDGRGRVELLLGRLENVFQRNVEEIAHAFGYRLLSTEIVGRARIRYLYERDDASPARRRAELTIARLHTGGPVLPALESPPSPPPSPPPPLPPATQPPPPRTPETEPIRRATIERQLRSAN
ncbi:hypothetical protein [Streptomyces sp. KM273126]|uniref:hypothetical protein n=1 Tax=Streptomyces sp. KM273126 TaxID=2545247 RepID=UPI00215D8F4D|nr:hypothetical protein [Streptomyces sp. KM273126]